VLIRGGVSGRERDEEDPPIFLDAVVPLAGLRDSGDVAVCVELGTAGTDADQLRRAREILLQHPGPAPLMVVWTNGGHAPRPGNGAPPRFRSRSLRVELRDEVLAALRAELGEERVKLVRA
jgi:DNA polymerase III subunit alpha